MWAIGKVKGQCYSIGRTRGGGDRIIVNPRQGTFQGFGGAKTEAIRALKMIKALTQGLSEPSKARNRPNLCFYKMCTCSSCPLKYEIRHYSAGTIKFYGLQICTFLAARNGELSPQ